MSVTLAKPPQPFTGTPLCKSPWVTGNLCGSAGVSWRAHSYDMETMGGSNEEHMLLCFNRAAHCARKGILYSYSDSSQWKSEPSLSQLSLQYPSAPFFPPVPFFSHPFFLTLILRAFILLIVLKLHVLSRRLKNNGVRNTTTVKGKQGNTKQTWKQRKSGKVDVSSYMLMSALSSRH